MGEGTDSSPHEKVSEYHFFSCKPIFLVPSIFSPPNRRSSPGNMNPDPFSLQQLSLTFKTLFFSLTEEPWLVLLESCSCSASLLLFLVRETCCKGQRNGEGEVDIYAHSVFSIPYALFERTWMCISLCKRGRVDSASCESARQFWKDCTRPGRFINPTGRN